MSIASAGGVVAILFVALKAPSSTEDGPQGISPSVGRIGLADEADDDDQSALATTTREEVDGGDASGSTSIVVSTDGEAPTEAPAFSLEELHRSFEEIYKGASREMLKQNFQSLHAQVSVAEVHKAHRRKVDAGEFEVIGKTFINEKGNTVMRVPPEVAQKNRPFLDRTHALDDGRMVLTHVDPFAVHGYEQVVAEAVWLADQIRKK